jgi:glutathione synthase/RimK-type ligase-like ATP-grasp enzyme
LSDRRQLSVERLENSLLRIESPGKNFEVDKLLLAKGALLAQSENAPHLTAEEVVRLQVERGLILNPRQWYLGFRQTLREWSTVIDSAKNLKVMNHPDDIAVMFDKRSCHELMRGAGISVPQSLGRVRSYEELLARMKETETDRVFVKLAHGSSAAGVVAFHCGRERQRAITTVELVRAGTDVRLSSRQRVSN